MTEYVKEASNAILLDSDLREAYDHEAENLLVERENGFEDGHAKGLEQGIEQGREEGLEQGREEGLVQGSEQKSFEVAKEMKKQGYSLKDICNILKEPLDKINTWLL